MRPRVYLALLLLLALVLLVSAPRAFGASAEESADARPTWSWPVDGTRRVIEPFRAPAHAYGPGHRGIDIAAEGGAVVRAPADGVVAFSGVVVDRPVLTVSHADGLVSSYEPLIADLVAGDAVAEGQELGTVGAGGHATTGALHLGVRRNGVYIDPMRLFGPVPRAVLLPCCAPL